MTEMYVVDVFAREKYTGNQLAVFCGTGSMSTEEMQRLTRETNYSEATFVESTEPVDGGYDVRIFDPAEEIPFAGHPTLGTASVLREFVRDDCPDEIALDLGVGRIPVWVEERGGEELLWMRQIPPTFEEGVDDAVAARVLGLEEGDVDDRYPVQLVSTGLPTVIVPLRSLDAVRRAETNVEPYYDHLIEPYGNLNLLLFAPETYGDADCNVRVFAECAGIPEDPATGSSNGCLAAYLLEHGYFGENEIEIEVEQGYEIDRPSQLSLRAKQAADEIEVSVGGNVIPIAEGRLL